jgi:PAS domain S-box-containing protein
MRSLEHEERELLTDRDARVRATTGRNSFVLSTGTFVDLGLLLTVLFFLNSEATERREAEAKSRLAADIVNSTGDAVITMTLAGTVTSWNPGAQLVFGYTAQEAVGSTVLKFVPPECTDEEKEMLTGIGRGERVHFETVRLRRNGQRVNVSITASPLRDNTGRITGAAKIARDITERKQAEAALKASEERLNFALQTTGIGAWELSFPDLSTNRTLIHANIFGYSTLLPPWNYQIFLEHVLPEDRDEVSRSFREARTALANWSFECRIVRADGEVRWICPEYTQTAIRCKVSRNISV